MKTLCDDKNLARRGVTSENDVTLCKLDVNVKNRTAVAGSVDFFET